MRGAKLLPLLLCLLFLPILASATMYLGLTSDGFTPISSYTINVTDNVTFYVNVTHTNGAALNYTNFSINTTAVDDVYSPTMIEVPATSTNYTAITVSANLTGSYYFAISANENGNIINANTSSVFTLVVVNESAPPIVNVSLNQTSATVATNQNFTFNLSLNHTSASARTYNFTLNDSTTTLNCALTNLSLSVNGINSTLCNITKAAPGVYTYEVNVTEIGNFTNTNKSQVITLTVENNASAYGLNVSFNDTAENVSVNTTYTVALTINHTSYYSRTYNITLYTSQAINYSLETTQVTIPAHSLQTILVNMSRVAPGEASIHINATDIGNGTNYNTSGIFTFNVTTDITAPVINSANLSDNYTANNTIVTIIVNATDETAIANVTADGSPLTLYADGLYYGNYTILYGVTNVTIIVLDTSGHNDTTSLNYTVDATPPSITSITLSDYIFPTGANITICAEIAQGNTNITSVTAEGSILLSWNGTCYTNATTALADEIPNIVAIDSVGNNQTNTTTFVIDDILPSISTTTPHSTVVTAATNNWINLSIVATDLNNLVNLTYKIDDASWQMVPLFAQNDNYTNGNLTLNFTKTGLHTLSFKATDTAANVRLNTTTFYSTAAINLTNWTTQLNTSPAIDNVTITYANGSALNTTTNNSINDTFNITIGTNNNITILLGDINGLEVSWGTGANDFVVETTNTTINQNLSSIGKTPANNGLVNILNLENFTTNYTAKVVFPHDASDYDGFYHCAETCTPITDYFGNGNETTVNVTSFSAVVAINDTQGPFINQTGPTNWTNKSFLTFTWETNELATCEIFVNGTLNQTLSTAATSFSKSIFFPNATTYNVNISCNDTSAAMNTNWTAENYTLNDTLKPTISLDGISSSTSVLTFTVTVNEPATVNLYIDEDGQLSAADLEDTESATSSDLTVTLSESSLDADTTHDYIINACDTFGYCYNISGETDTDAEDDDDDDSSSSSSNDYTLPTSSENYVDSDPYQTKVYASLRAGQHVTFAITKSTIPVKDVNFTVKEATDKVTLGAYTRTVVSDKMQEELEKDLYMRLYSYVELTHRGVDAATLDDIIVTFVIPKSWLNEKGISSHDVEIKRFTSNEEWVLLTLSQADEDGSDYLYTAEPSELGYFAVTGQGILPRNAPGEDPATEGEVEISETNQTGNQTATIEEEPPVEKKERNSQLAVLIIIIVLTLLISVGIAFYMYHRKVKPLAKGEYHLYQEHYPEKEAKPVKEPSMDYDDIKPPKSI